MPATTNAPLSSVSVCWKAMSGDAAEDPAATLPSVAESPRLTVRQLTTTPLPSGTAVTVPVTSINMGSAPAAPAPS